MSECGCEPEDGSERSLLLTLLAINAVMFGVELAAGIAADFRRSSRRLSRSGSAA